MNRIFLWMKSIQSKVILGFLSVMMVSFVVVTISNYHSHRVIEAYRQSLGYSLRYNDFFKTMEETASALQKACESSNPALIIEYEKKYPQMLQAVDELVDVFDDGTYNRALIDFQYMVQSYSEQGIMAIALLKNKNYSGVVEALAKARKLQTLLSEQYTSVYQTVLEHSMQTQSNAAIMEAQVTTLHWLLVFIAIVVSTLVIFVVSHTIVKPLRIISLAANEFSPNGLETDTTKLMKITSQNEIGQLATAFVQMQEKIRQQFELIKLNTSLQQELAEEELKVLRTQSLLKESELKALQSRINPHFMFNSLNMIAQMAYLEKAEQTAELMECLGDLLRYNLDQFSKVVTMEQEIQNVKDYILIQQKRFGSRIAFDVSCAPEVLNATLPCLILQPLVENAITHGVGIYTKDGKVGIQVKSMQEHVQVKVFDNGLGMDEETLSTIRALPTRKDLVDECHSIGVSNVWQRLKVFFEGNVTMEVNSNAGVYTEFCFLFPFCERKKA